MWSWLWCKCCWRLSCYVRCCFPDLPRPVRPVFIFIFVFFLGVFIYYVLLSLLFRVNYVHIFLYFYLWTYTNIINNRLIYNYTIFSYSSPFLLPIQSLTFTTHLSQCLSPHTSLITHIITSQTLPPQTLSPHLLFLHYQWHQPVSQSVSSASFAAAVRLCHWVPKQPQTMPADMRRTQHSVSPRMPSWRLSFPECWGIICVRERLR